MRSYEEIERNAHDKVAFSTGTEIADWQLNWCNRCIHDADLRRGKGTGCDVFFVALLGKTPVEWLEQNPLAISDRYHCIEFRDEDDDGGGEPQPIPDPPDQLTLLPREPYEGVRMYADVVAEAQPQEVPR